MKTRGILEFFASFAVFIVGLGFFYAVQTGCSGPSGKGDGPKVVGDGGNPGVLEDIPVELRPDEKSTQNPKAPCPPTKESFRDEVWLPILSLKCISCHNSEGAAKKSRLVLQWPSTKGHLDYNFLISKKIAAIQSRGTSILLSRAMGTHPSGHPGGALIRPGSPDFQKMNQFVSQIDGTYTSCGTKPTVSCAQRLPGKRRLRRLTGSEYDNTIRSLFGFQAKWGASFVADTVVNGFNNNADVLTVTPLLADQLSQAAKEIAAKAVAQNQLQRIVPCPVPPQNASDCARKFLAGFGTKVFRRPLSKGDIDRYFKIYELGAKKGFQKGIELLLTAMLQSPYFLYRLELGTHVGSGKYQLTSYEVAAELSYFFWGSMPDAALLQAAAADNLKDPKEIAKHAKRMLDSPKSVYVFERFFSQWLHTKQLANVPKDAKIFAAFSANVRSSMKEEVKRFISHVLTKGTGTFTELLTADYSIANKTLASFYGVTPATQTDPAGYGKVNFSKGNRGGLLTLGAVLTVHALPNDSSPIHRGLLVREGFLCQKLPPPPANVNASPPGLDPKKSTKERYSQHSKDPLCAGCHKMIDPIGFGFEHFDGIGRYRENENGHAIDSKGEIFNSASSDGTFQGVKSLSKLLVKSPDVHRCFSLQWLRWAYGVKEDKVMTCMVQDIQKTFVGEKLQLKSLLLALTQTPHFLYRMGINPGGAPSDGPVGEAGGAEKSTPDAGAGPDLATKEARPPEPPPMPAALQVKTTTDSKWQTGYCNRIIVTNSGTQPVDWKIRLKIEGKIKQLWNATSSPASGKDLFFVGVNWNKTLRPKQSTNFGFCAEL